MFVVKFFLSFLSDCESLSVSLSRVSEYSGCNHDAAMMMML